MHILKIFRGCTEKNLTEFLKKNDIKIILEKSDDKRSYHINSNKIYRALGFKPKYRIKDAVIEICNAFKKNKFSDEIMFFSWSILLIKKKILLKNTHQINPTTHIKV
mgnify:CR=1 FL=1